MPLYMDLHLVPLITARGVAEAHLLDLNIQDNFQCSCMTYWVDEANESAFCLIEAPNENSVRELHEMSHGLLPHHIIEVNKNTVASFLGRLYDPDFSGIQKEELKIFNDPAFRTLVFIDISDPVLVQNSQYREEGQKLLDYYLKIIKDHCYKLGGGIVEHKERMTTILCFSSSSNALTCALEITDAFTSEEKELLSFKVSLNSGMPVSSSKRIFGETIDLGERLLYTSQDFKIAVATSFDDMDRRQLDKNGTKISYLTLSEEKLLNTIFKILEHHSPDENFGIEDFCREAALSKSSLNRHIQSLTSRSPNALIKEFRMNKALQLLKNGEGISNAGFSSGFRSPSYFSRCFKEHYSISPSEYVDRLRGK